MLLLLFFVLPYDGNGGGVHEVAARSAVSLRILFKMERVVGGGGRWACLGYASDVVVDILFRDDELMTGTNHFRFDTVKRFLI